MTQQQSGLPGTGSRYKPIAELGRGGMATVYLAVIHGPAGFNKLQVIKRLRPALAADPEFLQMFLEEARLAARINHPNVVQTNEVGFDGQFYFIAMEYLDGQTLESINRKNRRLNKSIPPPMHLHALAETLAGLNFAHDLNDFDGTPLNVVHRDVSPHNVMIGYDGHVKILDFGIAKAADSSTDTRTGIMKGKCAYMAPEQFGGMKVDRRADIFAVGVMMWQAITGARLWKGQSDADIFAHLSRGEIPTPRSVKPDVPEELETICMRALAQKPEGRFQTAAEFQAAIENYLATAQLRVTPRAFGDHVSELFAENRSAIRAAIETQVSKGSISLEPSPLDDPKSPTDIPMLWSLVPTSQSDGGLMSTPSAEGPGPHSVAPTKPNIGSLAPRAGRLSLFAGVGLAAVAVAVFAATRRGSAEDPAPSASASSAVASSAPASSSTPALVRLTVRATPKEAHLFLDDAPLEGNPATGAFLKDGASHTVRAEATGYVTKRELATFDNNTLTIDVALDRERAAAAVKPVMAWAPPPPAVKSRPTAAAEAPADTPSPPATTAVTPPPPNPATQKPALDMSDPWSNAPKPK